MRKIGSPFLMTTVFLLLSISFIIVSAGEIVSDDSTILLLHLNNNALDSSSNTNDGEINGADCSSTGRFNQGCLFDGVDDSVKVPHISDYEIDSGTITFSFKPSVINKRQGLISKDALFYSTGGQFTVRTESDNSIKVILESTAVSRSIRSDRGQVKLDEWHDVAITFGSQKFKLFVNGVLMDDSSYSGGISGNKEPLVLGASTHRSGSTNHLPLADFFEGTIDEVVIWNRALSPSEISDLHNEEDSGSNPDNGDDGEEENDDDQTPDDLPNVPTVQITSPIADSTISTTDVTVTFTSFNWDVRGKGQDHIHFHLSNHPDYTFDDHFMFYNEPNSIAEFNFVFGETPHATWIDANTIQFNNVPEGEHELRAHLATPFHLPAGNPEADSTISFTIDTTFVDDTTEDETDTTENNETTDDSGSETNSDSSGSDSSGSGGGGGGGGSSSSSSTSTSSSSGGGGGGSSGCSSKWICDDWSECSSEGQQTRTCEKKYEHCRARVEKPSEIQNCTPTEEVSIVETEPQNLVSKITGAVINTNNKWKFGSAAVIALIVILVALYFLVWAKRN